MDLSDLDRHLTRFLGPPESPTEMASRSVQPFCNITNVTTRKTQTNIHADHTTPSTTLDTSYALSARDAA